ncbi:MAG: hypothetical protein R8G66_06365 [Cytophagales bacterium]|nr:hypothetical protein [Cytophagales bacterium]
MIYDKEKGATRFSIIILFFILNSCNSIPENVQGVMKISGDNSKEIQIVLDHYSAPKDSLKLRAAYFLIENITSKYSFDHSKIGDHKALLKFIDSVHVAQDPVVDNPAKFWDTLSISQQGHTIVDSFWDTLKTKHGNFSTYSLPIIPDIKVITSKLLIENIDSSFEVWRRPWAKHLSFDQFCQYILPYRNLTEPLQNWRNQVYENFNQVLDSLSTSNTSALQAAQAIYNYAAVVKNNYWTFREYPDLGWDDLDKIRMGTCRDQSNYIAYVMRSQGIPIGTVFHAHGTEWNVLLNSDGRYLQFGAVRYPPAEDYNYYLDYWKSPSTTTSKFFMHSYKEDLRLLNSIPISSIPPAFRDPNIKDVTGELHDNPAALEISLDTELNHNGYLFLCDFFSDLGWSAVDWALIEGDDASFKYLGTEKVYLPALYEDDEYRFVHAPVYIDENGKNILLEPNNDFEKVRLYRKFPRGVAESRFARKMVGDYFQVANKSDFSDALKIHQITKLPDRAEYPLIKLEKKYQFVRYVSVNGPMNVAELNFLDDQDQILDGKVIHSSMDTKLDYEFAFDGDIRTNYNNEDSSSWVGLRFDLPVRIAKVKYLFRNSFNFVEPGHEYELLYWKEGHWISLGKKYAAEDFIDFEAPTNALLRLKNHTEGKDEMVFFMRNGIQIWG